MATDIFTLNATLGATIEEQVVATLNSMRSIWDPNDKYKLYGFVRQSQTFPDVLLCQPSQNTPDRSIILGLELKGWYLLAKDGEPSFRFVSTPSASNLQDMIVVVPWALSNVISGSPRVFQPFVESARYAAEYRNYHWQYLRETRRNTDIQIAEGIKPYPRKSDPIADRPVDDAGGNFGRISRTGMMDDYIQVAKSQLLCGIEARHWLSFFKLFQEQRSHEQIETELKKYAERITVASLDDGSIYESTRTILNELAMIARLS